MKLVLPHPRLPATMSVSALFLARKSDPASSGSRLNFLAGQRSFPPLLCVFYGFYEI